MNIHTRLNICIAIFPVQPDEIPVSINIAQYHIVIGFITPPTVLMQYRLYITVASASIEMRIPPKFLYRKKVYSNAYIIVGTHIFLKNHTL